MGKSKGNGAVPISNKLANIALTDGEMVRFNMLDQALVKAKIALADAQVQVMIQEQRRMLAVQALGQAENAVIAAGKEMALAHGIDPDADPSEGRWNLTGGAFVRLQ